MLADMMVIALLAGLCGADGWTSVSAFGRAKRKWFKGFLAALPQSLAL